MTAQQIEGYEPRTPAELHAMGEEILAKVRDVHRSFLLPNVRETDDERKERGQKRRDYWEKSHDLATATVGLLSDAQQEAVHKQVQSVLESAYPEAPAPGSAGYALYLHQQDALTLAYADRKIQNQLEDEKLRQSVTALGPAR